MMYIIATHMRVKIGQLDQSFVEKKCTELIERGRCGCGLRPFLLLQEKKLATCPILGNKYIGTSCVNFCKFGKSTNLYT